MGTDLKRTSLYFQDVKSVAPVVEEIPFPGEGEVLVRTRLSAVSSGTEMLFYRGQVPGGMPVDARIAAFPETFRYPLKYGYACVGEIIAAGRNVPEGWVGKRVFAFHPHESHGAVPVADVVVLPETVSYDDAVFLPFFETAVNLVMDGRPVIGEKVVVFGQGMVGLATAALCALFPLGSLVTLDRHAARRERSRQLGAEVSLDPSVPEVEKTLGHLLLEADGEPGADLVFELSGDPSALDQAIAAAGYSARIIVGSWYGAAAQASNLGGRFHRDRIMISSSQVSTIGPLFTGRWSKQRRLASAFSLIERLRPSTLISHRFAIQDAPRAYDLLDRSPDEALQVVFEYP